MTEITVVSDILNQMSDITTVSNTTFKCINVNKTNDKQNHDRNEELSILRININNMNTVSKHIWSIPVNASAMEMALDDSAATATSNVTQPSDVTTLERINDIDLVESKLSDLRFIDETSL